MWVAICSSHIISVTSPYSLSSPTPLWGPCHGRQSSTNFSNVSPSHGLQFFTNCSSVGPFHRLQPSRKRTLQRGSPTGSEVLPANLFQHGLLSPQVHMTCQEPAPAQALHGVTVSFRHPPALACSPLRAASGYLLCCGPPWAAGDSLPHRDSLPHHGLHHGLQENLCSSAWSTSSPSFFTNLGVCRVVFSHTFSFLSSGCCSAAGFFVLLKSVSTEALPPLLIGSPLAKGRSALELGGLGFTRHRGSF